MSLQTAGEEHTPGTKAKTGLRLRDREAEAPLGQLFPSCL